MKSMTVVFCNTAVHPVQITFQEQTVLLEIGGEITLSVPPQNTLAVTLCPVRTVRDTAHPLVQKLEKSADTCNLLVSCTYHIKLLADTVHFTVSVAEYDLENFWADALEYRYCRLTADNADCTLHSCEAVDAKSTLRALCGWKSVENGILFGALDGVLEIPLLLREFRFCCRPKTIYTFLSAALSRR